MKVGFAEPEGGVTMIKATEKKNLSQSDKFKQAAREHGADEDEKRWEERLRKVAKAKPQER